MAANVLPALARRAPSPPATRGRGGMVAGIALAATALLGGAALWVNAAARRAEREHPPLGRFLDVDGARLHYVERGRGRPVVMLHGNMTLVEELDASGLLDLAARHYRVIAFDRPGYGRSTRPRDRVWTPAAQADLLHRALRLIGVDRPAVVVGHSFGTLVAVELALRHRRDVAALALLSGYYYPTARADVPLLSPPAIPVVGDVLRHTVSPLLGRLAWPGLLRVLFGPAPANPRFDALESLVMRPGPIRAGASESALLVPAAAALQGRLAGLGRVPVVIAAGAEDRFVGTEDQSVRLHRELPGSDLRVVPGAGHMVHHTAPGEAMAAIDLAARRAAGG